MEMPGSRMSIEQVEMWTSPHGRSLPRPGNRTLIMGILNCTPDSFSDGGKLASVTMAVTRVRAMVDAGADIIDIGGESTRPGAEAVSEETELNRVIPIIEALRKTWPELPISVDTYKGRVADAALKSGADVINDIWGLMYGFSVQQRAELRDLAVLSPERGTTRPPSPMAKVVAQWKCPVILMHNRLDKEYTDFWPDLLQDLKASKRVAESWGIQKHQLWLDPGFGFAKTPAENLEVLRDLRRLTSLEYPVVVGTSRKSTIGKVLGTEVEDRLEGSGATVVWAIQQGCSMIRVHEVREMTRFARMADAIKAGLDFKSS